MIITLDFEELGITNGFGKADIINRACDMVMSLCFPEFEETEVININDIHVIDARHMNDQDFKGEVRIPLKVKYISEF